MLLTPPQIYAHAEAAGFPPVVAETMAAIALRESDGETTAFNGNEETGDRSYGLWQINLRDAAVQTTVFRVVPEAAKDEKVLLDPAANARAAFALWNHDNRNLEIAWYIEKAAYKEAYEVKLKLVHQALLDFGPALPLDATLADQYQWHQALDLQVQALRNRMGELHAEIIRREQRAWVQGPSELVQSISPGVVRFG